MVVSSSTTARRPSPRLVALLEAPPPPQQQQNRGKDSSVTGTKRTTTGRQQQQQSKSVSTLSGTKKAIKKSPTEKPPIEKEESTTTTTTATTSKVLATTTTLARTREDKIKQERPTLTWVMGIDEAGRGPLAGPVVAAAAIVPTEIAGIMDSKKIAREDLREQLYEEIVNSDNVSWAVAVVDSSRIDEINILQATMQAMSMAAAALIVDGTNSSSPEAAKSQWMEVANQPACSSRTGCYVACGGKMPLVSPTTTATNNKKAVSTRTEKGSNKRQKVNSKDTAAAASYYYALIDGNRVPMDLPCDGESIIKGDSKEFSIAAASILAKVTRDRLMHGYDVLYPEYQLAKHKGYPTKDHKAAVFKFGASPIHRRTFAPLKHMEFDEDGKVVGEKRKETKT